MLQYFGIKNSMLIVMLIKLFSFILIMLFVSLLPGYVVSVQGPELDFLQMEKSFRFLLAVSIRSSRVSVIKALYFRRGSSPAGTCMSHWKGVQPKLVLCTSSPVLHEGASSSS